MKLFKNGSVFKLIERDRVLVTGTESVVRDYAIEIGMAIEDWDAAIDDMKSKPAAIADFGVSRMGFIYSIAA